MFYNNNNNNIINNNNKINFEQIIFNTLIVDCSRHEGASEEM